MIPQEVTRRDILGGLLGFLSFWVIIGVEMLLHRIRKA